MRLFNESMNATSPSAVSNDDTYIQIAQLFADFSPELIGIVAICGVGVVAAIAGSCVKVAQTCYNGYNKCKNRGEYEAISDKVFEL